MILWPISTFRMNLPSEEWYFHTREAKREKYGRFLRHTRHRFRSNLSLRAVVLAARPTINCRESPFVVWRGTWLQFSTLRGRNFSWSTQGRIVASSLACALSPDTKSQRRYVTRSPSMKKKRAIDSGHPCLTFIFFNSAYISLPAVFDVETCYAKDRKLRLIYIFDRVKCVCFPRMEIDCWNLSWEIIGVFTSPWIWSS